LCSGGAAGTVGNIRERLSQGTKMVTRGRKKMARKGEPSNAWGEKTGTAERQGIRGET